MNRRLRVRIHKSRPVIVLTILIASSWGVRSWIYANRELWLPQQMSEWRYSPPPRELAPMPTLCGNGPMPRWMIDGAVVERGPDPYGPFYLEISAIACLKSRAEDKELTELRLNGLKEDAPEHVYSMPSGGFYSVGSDYQYRPLAYPVAYTVPQVQFVQPMFVPIYANPYQRRAFVNTRGITESPLTGGLLRFGR